MEPVTEATRFRELTDELLTSWDALSKSNFVVNRRSGGVTVDAQFAVVHGLAAHAHVLAWAALPVLEMMRPLEAMPLIRAGYECALTAQWVAQTPDGAEAFVNEEYRQRRAHIRTLEKAAAEVFRAAAPGIAARMQEDRTTASSARNFEGICNDLAGAGPDAYAVYRLMSHLSHASGLVADQYLTWTDEAPHLKLRMKAQQPDTAVWTFFVPASLVWAGRAVDYFDDARRRRSQLRRAARELGIRSALQLSDDARRRASGNKSHHGP